MNTELLLKILNIPGVGRVKALQIIDEFKSELTNEDSLFQLIFELQKKYKLKNLSADTIKLALEKADQIITQSHKKGIRLTSILDEDYPKVLLGMNDFPLILNYKGDIKALKQNPSVAVVGAREATPFGYKLARRLGELLAQNDIHVVSGLALGCDTAGHEGALLGKGTTSAILAHGLDQIYPKENQKLAANILTHGGCLVSEYYVNQKPQKNFYVNRNRIQAGLSQGVIVVESKADGGTMHTAKFTKNYDRMLGCINYPEKYKSSYSKGNAELLKDIYTKALFSESEILNFIDVVQKVHQNQIDKVKIENTNHQLCLF